MLTNKKITVFLILLLTVIFLLPDIALAQADFGANALDDTGLGTANVKDIIVNIVNIALGFLGILATLVIMYGGWLWMTSQGSTEKVDKAKQAISAGIIGLVIILASYGIARFVISQIYGASQPFDPNGPGGGNGHGGVGLGSGVIESHYPGRNATEVPRNTNIYITFKEEMKIDEVGGLLTSDPCNFSLCAGDNISLTNMVTELSIPNMYIEATQIDGMVFGFNPYGNSDIDHLGNNNTSTRYEFALDSNIKKADDEPAFSLTGYDWNFTVSNEIDLTPPTITSVIPIEDATDNPRNVVIQINFSEGVNPMLATGSTIDGFDNIVTTTSFPSEIVAGAYVISNQYRTVEFITTDLCGTNSCGGDVYCLPGGELIATVVTTAIEDMAANNLATAKSWSFTTSNEIDLTPPKIIAMSRATGVGEDEPIWAKFDKSMSPQSIISNNITFVKKSSGIGVNYSLGVTDSDRLSVPPKISDIVNIYPYDLQTLTDYEPTLTSDIQDIYQNCWYPCACNATDGSCLCDNNDEDIIAGTGLDCPGSDCQVD